MADGGKCGKNTMWRFEDDGTLTISGTGEMYNYVRGSHSQSVNTPWWAYRETIKKVIICDGVTSIGAWAFSACVRLTEIKIPDSVTSIGEVAFRDCSNLKEITIPNGVTCIGGWTFNRCNSLKAIKIPDGVTTIGKDAFSGCRGLTSIEIPDSVTYIGDEVFYGCSGLREIRIPDSVTYIGDMAFYSCNSLREIKIPNGVTYIGDRAFYSCNSLREIKIPDSVTTIGESAFILCNSLREIKIPGGVTSIGNLAFCTCKSLEKIYCKRGTGFESILCECNNAEIIYYDDKPKPAPVVEKLRWKVEGKTLTVGGVREIPAYSYGELPWVESVNAIQGIVIEEGVETISAEAFAECRYLELLTIPASVKTIGDRAFTFCFCGDRSVNGGKNVLWSLDDGILTFKKNPAAKSDSNFSLSAVSWRAVEKNITGVKVERGIIPDKRFFDWLGGLSSDVPVSF